MLLLIQQRLHVQIIKKQQRLLLQRQKLDGLTEVENRNLTISM